jgi:hypothetical protein
VKVVRRHRLKVEIPGACLALAPDVADGITTDERNEAACEENQHHQIAFHAQRFASRRPIFSRQNTIWSQPLFGKALMTNCDFQVIGPSDCDRRPFKLQCSKCGRVVRSKYSDPKMMHANCRWAGTAEQIAFALAKSGCRSGKCGAKRAKA